MWLRYVVDVVSGSVIAFLGTKRKQKSGVWLRATLYQFNGNCVLSMPVSQTNWQNVFKACKNKCKHNNGQKDTANNLLFNRIYIVFSFQNNSYSSIEASKSS